jgi:hypothetical protein
MRSELATSSKACLRLRTRLELIFGKGPLHKAAAPVYVRSAGRTHFDVQVLHSADMGVALTEGNGFPGERESGEAHISVYLLPIGHPPICLARFMGVQSPTGHANMFRARCICISSARV